METALAVSRSLTVASRQCLRVIVSLSVWFYLFCRKNLRESARYRITNMNSEILYYVWALLLVVACAGAWLTTFFTLPGNWLMAGLAALFAFFLGVEDGRGIGWTTVGILLGLAAVAELIEFAAGAAGAAKEGASRRAMLLALVGTFAGSIAGAVVGVPIPVVGPILGALGGGAFGAFAGAYFGETWKGKSTPESIAVGKGALIGRLLGTLGKLLLGGIMLVVVVIDAFV